MSKKIIAQLKSSVAKVQTKVQTKGKATQGKVQAPKPAPKPLRDQAYRKFVGRHVGTEGNLSTTGVLPAPSEIQLAETNIDKMSNARLMHVWNANVDAANKAGIETVIGFEGGTIKVIAKRSLWLSTAHGQANLKALSKALKGKLAMPKTIPSIKLSKEQLEAAKKAASAFEKAQKANSKKAS
jgi:hypothetical protein